MFRETSLNIGWGNAIKALSADSNYLYVSVTDGVNRPRLYRISLSDFSLDENYIELNAVSSWIDITFSFLIDNYLFLSVNTGTDGYVVRIDLTNWQYSTYRQLIGGQKSYGISYRIVYNSLQVLSQTRLSSFTDPKGSFTFVSSRIFDDSRERRCLLRDTDLSLWGFGFDATRAFIENYKWGPSQTIRYEFPENADLKDLGATVYSMTKDSTYLYVTLKNYTTAKGRILRIPLSDPSQYNIWDFSETVNHFGAITFESYLYSGDLSEPSNIYEILTDSQIKSSIALQTDEDQANTAIFTSNKLYIGHEGNPIVTKIGFLEITLLETLKFSLKLKREYTFTAQVYSLFVNIPIKKILAKLKEKF